MRVIPRASEYQNVEVRSISRGTRVSSGRALCCLSVVITPLRIGLSLLNETRRSSSSNFRLVKIPRHTARWFRSSLATPSRRRQEIQRHARNVCRYFHSGFAFYLSSLYFFFFVLFSPLSLSLSFLFFFCNFTVGLFQGF